MKLKETFGKKIKILCVDGGSIEGRVIDYIPTIEEDEEECIIIRNENNVLIVFFYSRGNGTISS